MINFRFHIVSLTAVLLALGVGLVLGTSFLDEAVVDALRSQLDGLEQDLDESREEAGQMRAQITSFEDEHEALDQDLDEYLTGALAEEPILVISAEGMDGDLVPRLLGALESSGAQTLGVWELSGDLALDDEDQIERLGQALDLSIDDADRLRNQLVVDLGNVLFEVTDASLSADEPPADALLGPSGVSQLQGGDQGEGAGDGEDAEDPYEPAVAAALRENGLIEYHLPEGADGDVIMLPRGGVRVVILTGPEADVPNDLLLEILGSVASNGRVPVVVPSTTAALSESAQGEEAEEAPLSLLESVRRNEALAGRVTTVDNFHRAAGKMATILSLQAAAPGDPSVGHYGQAEGAEQLLPPPVAAQ